MLPWDSNYLLDGRGVRDASCLQRTARWSMPLIRLDRRVADPANKRAPWPTQGGQGASRIQSRRRLGPRQPATLPARA